MVDTAVKTRRQRLKRNLKSIIESIKKNYKPEKIILFGSLASGRVNPASDIDLLIIKNTRKRRTDRILDVLRICDYDVAFEPVVYTPKEIQQNLKDGDCFTKEILKKGKLLYVQE